MSIQHPLDSCFFFHAFPPTICFFRITRGVEIFAAFSYCSGPLVYWHRANEARLVSSMRSQHESPTSFYITRYSKTSVKRGGTFSTTLVWSRECITLIDSTDNLRKHLSSSFHSRFSDCGIYSFFLFSPFRFVFRFENLRITFFFFFFLENSSDDSKYNLTCHVVLSTSCRANCYYCINQNNSEAL